MTAIASSPEQIVREALLGVPEIEQAYISGTVGSRLTVLSVIATKDYDALERIFRAEVDIVVALPGVEVGFDLVIREGRPFNELVSPCGTLLFART